MERVAADILVAPELKKLQRELKRSSNGLLELELEADLPTPGPPPVEPDDTMTVLHFPCCSESVKLEPQQQHFCVICGQVIDMNANDAQKVFLSHKGVDKAMVNDFKETLRLLGYDPWIDEDAMPAGTPLERGIRQGMKDSCGAVFFITPSFKDEGFLQSEIDYAIQEKRDKGDRFAIIALQFDEDGKLGDVPELLRTYVWKKPKTHLGAFREISRALPIETGQVDWREQIAGIVQTPKRDSASAELSDEAKQILWKAANGDGRVMYVRTMGGVTVQVAGEQMVGDQSPKCVARWVGGLEDLQLRRLIRDLGHKGEVFEVTREGHEVAETIQADPND